MLTSQPVIDDLIKKLNDELNIPIASESQEAAAIRWVVERVAPQVPEWALACMASAADGVSKEELQKHRDLIVAEINKLVNIPKVPEYLEGVMIGFVVDGLLSYALEGNAIPAS